jgi:hypothetical protein
MNTNNINIDELIKYWKDTLPPLEDYAKMVGAPESYYGQVYVYEDPYGYYADDTIAALEELKRLRKFKEYFDKLYGKEIKIIDNINKVPNYFEDIYEEALSCME